MDNGRKIKLTVLICVMADIVILTLIVLVFGTYRNKKADATPAAETAAAADDTADASNGDASNGVPANDSENAAGNSAGNGSSADNGTTAAANTAAGELTKEDVKRLLEEGTKMYVGWVVGWGVTLDRTGDTLTENNMNYYLVTDGEYKSIEEIETAMHAIYTNACCADRCSVDSLYIERDGKLYGYELLGQGGDASPEHVDVKILSQTESECSIRVEYNSVYANDWDTTLVKEDGKWKFQQPINVFTGYPFFTDTVPWVD